MCLKGEIGAKIGDFVAKIELLDADRENRLFLKPNLVGLRLVAVSR